MPAKKKPAKSPARTDHSLAELIADSEHLRKRTATLRAELKQLASDVAENRMIIDDRIKREKQ
jgi:hypothetical protein